MEITLDTVDRIIHWIQKYMESNGNPFTPVVVGLSGGKDSTITAAICKKALGANRIIGVSIPDKNQSNKEAQAIAKELGIGLLTFSGLSKILKTMYSQWEDPNDVNSTVKWNTPARLRMTILYMLANQYSGRVANTCNFSESFVGYDTRWGDQCGDFSPFQMLTATEVKEVGKLLGVSAKWVNKTPNDGMCGQSDEERWGFTYTELDTFLRGGKILPHVEEKIKAMHKAAIYKIESIMIPHFDPEYDHFVAK